jgi:predicted nucleotidyltransferase
VSQILNIQAKPWAVTKEKISQVVELLALDDPNGKIVMFGSAARGNFGQANDLDLLIIKKNLLNRYSEVIRLRRLLSDVLMPIDLIVSTESNFKERSLVPGTLEYRACMEGEILYEPN